MKTEKTTKNTIKQGNIKFSKMEMIQNALKNGEYHLNLEKIKRIADKLIKLRII